MAQHRESVQRLVFHAMMRCGESEEVLVQIWVCAGWEWRASYMQDALNALRDGKMPVCVAIIRCRWMLDAVC